MDKRNFRDLIEGRWSSNRFVCVGLDSDLNRIPRELQSKFVSGTRITQTIVAFNRAIIDATHDLVCAYKPNSAFYEKYGVEGLAALEETILYVRKVAPEVPVILDSKRGDIGNTSAAYAHAAFVAMRADAVTVNPYLGTEALRPFLHYSGRGVFVLCRTSNRGSSELQELPLGDGGHNVFREVAIRASCSWNYNGNCGLVVGATHPRDLAAVRKTVRDMPILIPGIGAQGGDIKATVSAGLNEAKRGIIVNSSRGIIFASDGDDFADAARRETEKLHDAINDCL